MGAGASSKPEEANAKIKAAPDEEMAAFMKNLDEDAYAKLVKNLDEDAFAKLKVAMQAKAANKSPPAEADVKEAKQLLVCWPPKGFKEKKAFADPFFAMAKRLDNNDCVEVKKWAEGGFPLHACAQECLFETMKVFLAAGADINQELDDKTAIGIEIEEGEVVPTREFFTPLMMVALPKWRTYEDDDLSEHPSAPDMAAFLIGKGADPYKQRDPTNEAPIFWHCSSAKTFKSVIDACKSIDEGKLKENMTKCIDGGERDIFDELQDNGVGVSNTDEIGPMVELMVANGKDPNAFRADAYPLGNATQFAHVHLARALLNAGADANKGFANKQGEVFETPLGVAVRKCIQDIEEDEEYPQEAEMEKAQQAKHMEILKLLLETGASSNIPETLRDEENPPKSIKDVLAGLIQDGNETRNTLDKKLGKDVMDKLMEQLVQECTGMYNNVQE
eukprot:TRINITY_DN11002_c0_g1_i3.p1 TRINITY_DN11002_c0_g1~~TRINITY_DN11002_c0_g1_i3.p1  ORF type:complete len:447 (+),score=102.87 TRINITY_DN11002_c0_g1_i3:115-1455(+)